MARTRQQEYDEARREAATARAASRHWSRSELLQLLRAWRHVLRHPQARHESSDELELRLYDCFHALTPGGDSSRSTTAMGLAVQSRPPLRDGIAVSHATQILKRTFRFISEYNQKHGRCSPGTSVSGVDGSHNNISSSIAQNADQQFAQKIDSEPSRPWFQLTAEERQEEFMLGQRNRRVNSFMDIDEDMFSDMTVVMSQTMHQLRKIRRSKKTKLSEKDDATESLSEQPWSSAEIWQLLHAWRETLEDPDMPLLHSLEFRGDLFQRFEDSFDGDSQRSEASVRHKKTSLVSLLTLIKVINSRCEADRDWFALTSSERIHIYRELNQMPENYSELDRRMFSMLTFILKLEHGSSQTGEQQQQQQHQEEEAHPEEEKEKEKQQQHHQLQLQLQEQEETAVDEQQHTGSSCDADNTIDLISDGEDSSDEKDAQDSNNSEREDETGNCLMNNGAEQSSGAPPTEAEDTSKDVKRDGDGDGAAEHCLRQKRQRLDPELFLVVSILEKEARHLRAMLQEAKEERELDQEERRRLWEQMKDEQDARRREQVEWRLEKEQLLQNLKLLRNQHR